MTRRGRGALAALVTAAICGLSLGGRLYFLIASVLVLVLLYGVFSCLWGWATVKCGQRLSTKTVFRGEKVQFELTLAHRSLLPLGAILCEYTDGAQESQCEFSPRPFSVQKKTLPIGTRHVGQMEIGARCLLIRDLFGLVEMKKGLGKEGALLTVLPRPFEIEKPEFAPGDDGSAALSRTQEDYNAPEDVRSYQPGDAMKRIHWKLSSRKRELLVRRFEMPAPPDTLILLDCNEPLGGDQKPEGKACLRDALCETAVAVAKMQMADASPVRLPLYGQKANEFSSDHAASLSILQEMLACQPFEAGEDFARVLELELRRMRRTGAAVMITTRLDAKIVDGVSQIRRMGPSARLYLVTYTPDDPSYQPFVARLQHHLVEVCYVTPA